MPRLQILLYKGDTTIVAFKFLTRRHLGFHDVTASLFQTKETLLLTIVTTQLPHKIQDGRAIDNLFRLFTLSCKICNLGIISSNSASTSLDS